jgi:predicted patatin/cPLA2 family phospholipase
MLAISSGGDHSAYVLGMLKGVFRRNPELTDWSKLAGISAGALLGTKISQIKKNDYPSFIKTIDHMMHSHVRVCKQWSSLGKAASYLKAFIWHNSMFKSSIVDLVQPEWSEEKHRELYVGAFNETQGKYQSFGPSPTIHEVSASASVPVAFSPVMINNDQYCDGAMRHVIPVNEIKKHWTSGSLDLMLCYPTDYEAYLATSNAPSRFKIVDEAWNAITRSQWVNYNNDLDELAHYIGQDIRSGGIFDVEGKTLRVYVPQDGIYCDFIHRDMDTLSKMHKHGEEVALRLLS